MAIVVSWGQSMGVGLEECRGCHTTMEGASIAWTWEEGRRPGVSAAPQGSDIDTGT